MKTLAQFKPILASIMLGTTFILAPIAASANTTPTPQSNVLVGTVITTDGFVRVAGATITAVSGSVVNATTAFGGNILNWILNIGADTKIVANGTTNASTTALQVGDSIHFTGTLASSTGSVLVVGAKTVYDATAMQSIAHFNGVVATINTSTNSFTVTKKDGTTIMVNTDSGTQITINGATSALGSLVVGNTVGVVGHLNSAGTVLAATSITVNTNSIGHGKNDSNGNDSDKDDSATSTPKTHTNKGLHLGAFMNLNHFFGNDR